MSSLVLWNKMMTKLHIFLSSEKYLIIIRTLFLNDYGHWSKWREGGWSYPVGRQNPVTGVMVQEKGVKKFLLDGSDFFLRLIPCFLCQYFFILAFHLIFPQTILGLEIKIPDCVDSQWYIWLKKKWILGPLSMCDMSFRKGGVAGLHARGDTKKGEWYSFSNYAGVESGLCNQMRQIVSF